MENSDRISLATQIKLMNARLDCLIDLSHLNGELVKCALRKLGTEQQYQKTVALYEKHHRSIIKDCADEIGKIMEEASKPNFKELTVEEAKALNEAARRTCEMDG